ncbi:MAG: glycosyltransferase family 1 protein [candidate division WOR-3 bacterium]
MILTIDGSNSISGGAVAYLSNLLKYAEPGKYGIKKIILYSHKRLLQHIENRTWLEKIHEPELDKGLISRLKWLWFKFPKLTKDSDLIFFAGANYTVLKVPYVAICHNILPFVDFRKMFKFSFERFKNEYRKFSQIRCFENSRGVIFLSNYAKDIMINKLKQKPQFIKVIPHGLEERFFCEPRKQKEISEYTIERPFKVLYVSAISIYKYQWNVIKAFSILRKKGYPAQIDFIGGIYDKMGYKLFVKALKECDPDGNFSRYIAQIPYSEIHNYYRNYDAYIFASTHENLPFSLLETIASGLPIASSDFGLTREILGNDAVYFDPRSPESIAEAVIRLIEDRELREKIAWNNFEKAKRYNWKICAEETLQFISLVLKNRR